VSISNSDGMPAQAGHCATHDDNIAPLHRCGLIGAAQNPCHQCDENNTQQPHRRRGKSLGRRGRFSWACLQLSCGADYSIGIAAEDVSAGFGQAIMPFANGQGFLAVAQERASPLPHPFGGDCPRTYSGRVSQGFKGAKVPDAGIGATHAGRRLRSQSAPRLPKRHPCWFIDIT
jgi:hypothetical protein